MKTCATCGFDLWKYNASTYTCKHGHRFGLDGKPVPAQPVYVPGPPPAAVPFVKVVEHKQPLALAAAAGALAAVVVDAIVLLIA